MTITTFSTLGLKPALLDNLQSLDYLQTTPVQGQSLPLILQGKDVIARAQTGSGKTAAFGLGLLNALELNNFNTQALVLCPTRELADQVATEIRRLGRTLPNMKVLSLCGGVALHKQVGSLTRAAHIVVGTPGRIEDLLKKSHLRLDSLNTLVLDEADRMLDMGFQDSLESILEFVPSARQTLLFSATYPPQIGVLAGQVMVDPVTIEVAAENATDTIKQHFYCVDGSDQRFTALHLLLFEYQPESALVFCNTREMTRSVADQLAQAGFSALALHGDLDQRARDQTLARFANKTVSVLVATDVAARGLHIEDLDAVINYYVARDTELHTHRIGRTGRAGKSGLACTLYTDQEQQKLARLEQSMGQTIAPQKLPALELLNKQPYQPKLACLRIDAGKKQKIRAGDVLGALTGEGGIESWAVGKITIADRLSYVAVNRAVIRVALKKLTADGIKGRRMRVNWLQH